MDQAKLQAKRQAKFPSMDLIQPFVETDVIRNLNFLKTAIHSFNKSINKPATFFITPFLTCIAWIRESFVSTVWRKSLARARIDTLVSYLEYKTHQI